MRIVIYTSENRGPYNDYNLAQLIVQRPEHEYLVVSVNRHSPKITNWIRFKRFVVGIRDGQNHWLKDQERLSKKINQKIDPGHFRSQKKLLVNKVNDQESVKVIKEFDPDIIIQSGAGILKENIFSLAKIATLNVHHGLAPEIRGMHSTYWCLVYGLTDSIGVTCHLIDKNLDTGNVINRFEYPYSKGDDFISIQTRLCEEGAKLLIEAIDRLENTELRWKTEEVKSYYFSKMLHEDYNALHKNGFAPIKSDDLNSLAYTMKPKTYLD